MFFKGRARYRKTANLGHGQSAPLQNNCHHVLKELPARAGAGDNGFPGPV
jgi:hypothetical protein